jgi:NAD(P)-dependent dehydrogenase (short-subunit alcohol dehydrogenase family)
VNIHGTWALVTGGSKGIGRETVQALASRGARVLFTYRTGAAEAEALAHAHVAGQVEGFACDVRDPGAIDALVREIRGRGIVLDILVNNAGGPIRGSFTEATAALWQEAFDLHVRAPALFAKGFVGDMKERRAGVIVNIGSVAGMRGIPGATVYSTVKAAVIGMTRSMARDLGDFGVRALCVSPGIIRTDFHKAMTPEAKAFNEEKRIPLHREGTAAEVAKLIVALVENDYCTGDNYVIDGGLSMRIV